MNELILLPVLKAHLSTKSKLVMTKKYLEGAEEYAKHWQGKVTTLVELTDTPTTDMDHEEVDSGVTGTAVEVRPTNISDLADRIKTAGAVLAFLGPYEEPTAKLCKKINVPLIFVSEYSLKTAYQIIETGTSNPILQLRRKFWAFNAERANRRSLQYATALQCSGTPTYEAYQGLIDDKLLFFDNRVYREDIISCGELEQKAEFLRQNKPLRLVYGGRLVAMKGVLDLIAVAAELRALDIPFSLDIVGRGPQEQSLKKLISSTGLNDIVSLHPPSDFRTGWVPLLKQKADVFVCCHPQGDPSSTYPEVMSCGLPICGYANDAFRGIVQHAKAGIATPLGDPRALAKEIAKLHLNRALLISNAKLAREFAIQNSFEVTFARRANQIIQNSRTH